ncbi:MAG TPA: type IVB secretion system protein IcmH/DotU [Gammaproteobacteria bacterium]|nr:type IVB secretion system protein IcmH/DotU [Gammaproteobacteria bacterium]
MIATQTENGQQDSTALPPQCDVPAQSAAEQSTVTPSVQQAYTSTAQPLLLPSRTMTHHPQSGLNPIVDAASYLFSILSKLKHLKFYHQLSKLQTELIQELNHFQEAIKHHGYPAEYMVICQYVLCTVLDETITHTPWGNQGQWSTFSLLNAFNHDTHHQDKFFSIMEGAIKDPRLYIDLMELMYICLSMGYRGQYRATEHSQYQLEQITSHLYKHIQVYRGTFSRILSPAPLKIGRDATQQASARHVSLFFVFFVTACIILSLFVSLNYFLDNVSKSTYTTLAKIEKTAQTTLT